MQAPVRSTLPMTSHMLSAERKEPLELRSLILVPFVSCRPRLRMAGGTPNVACRSWPSSQPLVLCADERPVSADVG